MDTARCKWQLEKTIKLFLSEVKKKAVRKQGDQRQKVKNYSIYLKDNFVLLFLKSVHCPVCLKLFWV